MAIRMTCRGISPLLMQRLHEEEEGIDWKQLGASASAKHEASLNVHRHGGVIGLRPRHMMYCLQCAVKRFTLQEVTIPGPIRDRLMRSIVVLEQFLPLGVNETAWIPRRCKFKPGGVGPTRVVTLPEIRHWGFTVTMRLDTNELSNDAFRALVEYAGKSVGLQALRPHHMGRFGRFEVAEWRVIG